jgi:hypothetical protein
MTSKTYLYSNRWYKDRECQYIICRVIDPDDDNQNAMIPPVMSMIKHRDMATATAEGIKQKRQIHKEILLITGSNLDTPVQIKELFHILVNIVTFGFSKTERSCKGAEGCILDQLSSGSEQSRAWGWELEWLYIGKL